MTTLIVSHEIHADKVPIALFCNVFDAVLRDYFDRFQDFEKISKTLRLVAFPHLVVTESASIDLQMGLVEIKNDEQLEQKFKKICWKLVIVQLNILCYENWQENYLLFLEALMCANQHFQRLSI